MVEGLVAFEKVRDWEARKGQYPDPSQYPKPGSAADMGGAQGATVGSTVGCY